MKILNKKTIFNIAIMLLAYVLVFALINSGILSRQYKSLIVPICVNIMLAVSLNLVTGFLGELSLGHAGFMSIGAYTAALLTKSGFLSGYPGYIVALIVGGIVAGIIGFIIGIPALRLTGDYLAIITLAFGEIIRVLIEYFKFTGGAQGLTGIPRVNNFTLIYFITIFSVIFMYSIMTSRHGRAVLAIREDEIASGASGINTTYYKTFAFVLSAIFAGIAGGIYAHNLGILGAKQFDYNYSINILVMVVLGGMGLPFDPVAIVFPIDSIIDMGRTAVNVNGAMVISTVVDKEMGSFNESVLKSERVIEA